MATLTNMVNERLISVAEATKIVPRMDGKKETTKPVLFRWMHTGLIHRGERVRLESIKIGGVYATSAEAVERFLNRISTIGDDTPVRTPTRQRIESSKATQELIAAGM